MLDDRAWEPPDRWKVAQGNLARLRQMMQENGVDAYFLNRSDAVRYVAGTIPSDNLIFSQRVACLVLAHHEQPILFAQSHGASSLRGHFWIDDIRPLPRIQTSWPDLVEQALSDYGLSAPSCRLGMDATMEAYPYELMIKRFPKASVQEYWGLMTRCRAIKSADEAACIDHACILGELSIDTGMRMMHIGSTEIELAAEMSRVAIAAGAEGLYARRGTVVTSGIKLIRHDETPSSRRLRNGDLALIDVGPIVHGYYTDFARTVCIGQPSDAARRAYTVSYDAMQLCIELFKPGVEGAVAAQKVVDYIKQQSPSNHVSGLTFAAHGIGTASQEPPYFVPVETSRNVEGFEIIEPGMVLSLATGVYSDEAACRLEEVIHITETGSNVLSRSPFYGFDVLYEGKARD